MSVRLLMAFHASRLECVKSTTLTAYDLRFLRLLSSLASTAEAAVLEPSPSVGTDAAFEDLTFLQNMIMYKNFAPTFAERTFKELAKLKCLLNEETVVFALFSNYSEFTNKKKRKLMDEVDKKLLVPCSDEFRRGIPGCSRAITIDHATELHDMIRPESWLLL